MDYLLPYPSLYAGFEASAARWPERIAIREEGRDILFATLHAASREAARALIALGLEPGDRVAIWATNHAAWVTAGLANQAAGGILIPASTRLKAREVAAILRRVKATILFCDQGFGSYDFVSAIQAEDLPSLRHIVVLGAGPDRGRVIGWTAFLTRSAAVADNELDARIAAITRDAVADIIFTSGTTGVPKGVPITHGQSLIACEQQQLCVSQFRDGDVIAVTFPFAHNAGYRAGWQAALLYGVRIVPVRSYDPLNLIRMIERERISVMPAVPTIYQAILDHPERGDYDLSSLRVAATGATTIPVKLIERMQTEFGTHAVRTGYGLTECAGSVTSTRDKDSAPVIATTTGVPLANLEVKLVDSDHVAVAAGTPGEIAIRGPQVMRNYFDDEEATAKAFTADGFLLTGDVGLFDAAGNLRITDRIKDMYIVGGFNTYPAEVEQQLSCMDGVREAAVIGVEDERLGQVGRAFIIRDSPERPSEAEIIAWCRETMANYKVPKSVVFVDDLPRTASGKVSKVELRDRV